MSNDEGHLNLIFNYDSLCIVGRGTKSRAQLCTIFEQQRAKANLLPCFTTLAALHGIMGQ